MDKPQVTIAELTEKDLPFLFELWHNPQVMRHADEFPRLRGWSRSDGLHRAWRAYQARRDSLGKGYVQFIVLSSSGIPIGESAFFPLPEGYAFGRWTKPVCMECLLGDIKLLPAYWGQGLGTEALGRVVRRMFESTGAECLVVPPHRKNSAAQRVYEKVGFALYREMRSHRNHRLMLLDRERWRGIDPGN